MIDICAYLSCEQVSQIFTTFLPSTIREFAADAKLPVAFWVGKEPLFERNTKTIRQFLRVSHDYTN